MHAYLNTAIKAARSAGTIIARSVDMLDRIEITGKGAPNDFVTSVDKASEAEIIKQINKAYPDHGILGEETGMHEGTNPNKVVWIVDPLDGTLNFIHGFPQFCVSIGIQVRGVVEHAVVYNPISNELYTASKGEGAQLDGRRLRVSGCQHISSALIGTGFAYKRTAESKETCINRLANVLEKSADIRRPGAAALDLAFVAAGRLDGFYEVGLAPWDMAAGALLVREAGGFVGDFDGGDQYFTSGQIVAATPKVYPDLLALMKA